MASIPKKVIERYNKQIPKFKKILDKAFLKDINESDTVTIVKDMLCDIFGYDRYDEITSEYAIKNTYCDLAVKIDDKVHYLIEVKSISTDLKEQHLKQAINYGANEGIKWVVLTNGFVWQVYGIQLKDSVQYDKIFEIDFHDISPRKKEIHEMLFSLSKEGLARDVISEYQIKVSSLNRYIISALLLDGPVLDCLRKELKRMSPGVKIENEEIVTILKNEVLKRNVLEEDKAIQAQKRVKKYLAQKTKKKNKNKK